MQRSNPSGVNSIALGAISIVVVSLAQHWETFRGTGSSYLITLADRLGLVRASSPYAEVEAKASSLLAFTDETALVTVLGYGVYLAASSVLLAIWAEVKREENLYLSAGFMCGSGGCSWQARQ